MASQAPNLLKPGDALGPYRVDALIGKGGMGEVYRGTDTRLGRSVAIKVSAREFNDRFEREAKAISSLNHPNVCTLYDVVVSKNAPNYLVMEFVEGDTLSHLIKQGPMPLDKVLQYGIQIADALSAAHAKGVIHRDLKPANIILTSSGVKVLDFGLAKLNSAARFGASGSSDVVTRTEPMTESGSIVGSLHYMSPEQAEGKDTDERSDIFSFGAVLYEMLTGKRAFDGDTKTAILAAILKDQPQPISQFQPQVPRALDRVVRKCLEKKPAERWHSAHDLKQTLELIDLTGPTNASASGSQAEGLRHMQAEGLLYKSKNWLWAAAGVIAAGVGLVMWAPWKKAAPTQAVRFEVGPAEKMAFINQAAMAVSPDGRWMVFPAAGEDGKTRYYLRALDGVEVRALVEANQSPASWSYDSRWVVFAVGNKLKKIDIQGGPPQNIADFPSAVLSGAGWNPDGVIVAAAIGTPILRVPASGGQMTPITALATGESGHAWPQFLPDGKHFLYLRVSSDAGKGGVYIGSIDAEPEQQSMQRLLATDRQAYYAAAPGGGAGHLIFLRGATLMAQPFDPGKMTLSGEPAAIADGVDSFAGTSHGLFSVSDTGTLVYRGGSGTQNVLTWFDLQGNPAGHAGRSGRLLVSSRLARWQPRGCRDGSTGESGHLDSGCGARHQHALHLRSCPRRLSRLVARRQEHRVQLQSRRARWIFTSSPPTVRAKKNCCCIPMSRSWKSVGPRTAVTSCSKARARRPAGTYGRCRFRWGPPRFSYCRRRLRKANHTYRRTGVGWHTAPLNRAPSTYGFGRSRPGRLPARARSG